MTRAKKFFIPVTTAIIVMITVLVSAFSASAYYAFDGAKMITDKGYKYYRAWSQDQYPWHYTKPSDAWESDWTNRYGCSLMAMAKMFVEAGVADPETTNPYTLITKYGSPSKGIGDIGIYWSTLAGQFGMTCHSFQRYPSGSFYQTAMNYFNKTDRQYYLLLKVTLANGGTHYVHVDRQATVKAGELVVNESTNTQDASTRYNSASDYYNSLALLKLSKCNVSPDFFVVFSVKANTKMKSLKANDDGSVKLTWYPNGACEKYNVFRRVKGAKSWTGTKLATVKSIAGEGLRSYTDKTAKVGVTYEYMVRGYYTYGGNTIGLNYNTSGKEITILPGVPKIKSVTSVNHKTINIKWNKINGCDTYKIYRKAVGDKSWSTLKDSVKSGSFDDTTAVCGKKYYYTVRAYINGTKTLGAMDKTGVQGTALPITPKLLKTESMDFNKIMLTWEKADNVTGYAIYRKTGSESFKKIAQITGCSKTSFDDSSTITGTEYYYSVKAFKTIDKVQHFGSMNKTGIKGKSLTKPTVINSFTSYDASQIRIQWNKVNGANGYIVYRKKTADKKYTKLATISGNGNTYYNDKTAECCVDYDYRVSGYRTVDGKKIEGFASDSKICYSNPAEPGLVSTESVDYNSVKITWTKVKSATMYRVYRKTTGAYEKLADVKGNANLTYTDTTATTGVKYTYAVRGFCQKNKLSRYSTIENYIYGTAYPNAPVMKKAVSIEHNEVEVSWGAVNGASGYLVYRKNIDGTYKSLGKVYGKSTLKYNDKTAVCGTEYAYAVKAFRTVDGVNYYGGKNKGVKCQPLPSVPVFKVEIGNYNTLRISWNEIKGVSGYRLYYKKGSAKNWTTVATFGGDTTTSCSQTSLTTGTEYTYTVRAYLKTGGKTWWGSYNKTGITQIPQTEAPHLVSVKAVKYNSITLNWKTVAGASGYKVYRKGPDDKAWAGIAVLSGKSSVSYTDTNAVCGTKYSYTARAYRTVSGSKKFGEFNRTGLSTATYPETPTISLKSETYNKIKVTWTKSGGATGYKIYRRVVGGNYKMIKKITSGSTTSYTDTVECGADYNYYITAYITVGKTDYGSFDSAAGKCRAVPNTPVLGSAVNTSQHSIHFTWSPVSGASGYYIYRKDNLSSTYKLIYDDKSATAKSFVDVNVEADKKYTYTVKAYRICTLGYISSDYDKTGVSVVAK